MNKSDLVIFAGLVLMLALGVIGVLAAVVLVFAIFGEREYRLLFDDHHHWQVVRPHHVQSTPKSS